MSNSIINKVFSRFPSLIPEIQEICSKVLALECDASRVYVDAILDSEQGYIFTNDYTYLMKRASVVKSKDDGQQEDASSMFVRDMRNRIDSYFGIVVRNVRDSLPKIIGFFLVKKVQVRSYQSTTN